MKTAVLERIKKEIRVAGRLRGCTLLYNTTGVTCILVDVCLLLIDVPSEHDSGEMPRGGAA